MTSAHRGDSRRLCFAVFASLAIFGALLGWGRAEAADTTVLIHNVSVNEGNSGTTPATFTLEQTGHPTADVTVHYSTSDGTATAPGDYTAASGDVVVPVSGTVKITVLVKGDKISEPDETFNVSVVPKSGEIGDGQAVATIVNDDVPPPTPKPVATAAPATTPTAARTPAPVTSSKHDAPLAAVASSKPAPSARPTKHVNSAPMTSSGASLIVSTSSGATNGPAGSGLVLQGTGWVGCGQVVVSFGSHRLGVVSPGTDGAFDTAKLSLPGDAKPGRTELTATCPGSQLEATSAFDVVYASNHRTEFATSLHNPTQVSFKPKDVAKSLIPILILTLLLGFVTELFNSTYEENYDEIRWWLKLKGKKEKRERTRLERGFAFALIVLLGGILCAFVTPDVGLNLSTVGLVFGMCIALVVVTIGFDVPNAVASWRHFREGGEVTAMPSTLVVAAVCVIASRIVHFEPGLLYGLLAVLTFRREFGDWLEGKLGAIACAGILALSIGAWIAMIPVTHAAQHSSNFWVFTLEATLASVCLLGLETLTFVLMPVRFMMGPKIKAWNKYVWFVLFTLSAGMYVHVLLRPGLGYVGSNTSMSMSVIIFAVIPVIGSIVFWSYFRYRPERWIPEAFRDADEADLSAAA